MSNTETLSVVVVYEDLENRETAVAFCDGLVEKFWSRFGFDVGWWSFDLLAQASPADEASVKAAEADLVVFATRADQELPRHLEAWLESWLSRRENHEGALIGLVTPEVGMCGTRKDCRLRQLARQANMDYFTQLPQNLHSPIPEECDSYADRAQQMTDVLEGILHQPPPHALP